MNDVWSKVKAWWTRPIIIGRLIGLDVSSQRELEQRLRLMEEVNAKQLWNLDARAKTEEALRSKIADLETRLAIQRALTESACDGYGLMPAEIERLAMLAEVSGRIAAEVGWVLRNGWGEPEGGGLPGRVAMERELGRARCVMNLAHDAGDVRGKEMKAWQEKFRYILAETMRHQVTTEAHNGVARS